eukprot:jgi/Psemu1/16150/gm1.16150_g
MLKDPDPEILYPIYQIGQKVVYVGDLSRIGLVDAYVSEQYKDRDAYPSGEAQRKKKGKLLEDENSESSSDSDQVSVYDPSNGGHSDSEEDNKC